MAGYAGAAMLCYVTPTEHLGLPDVEDVRQGVIAYKIAAHAADVARGRPAPATATTRYPAPATPSTGRSSSPSPSTRRRARRMHDETLRPRGLQDAEFCSMCGPKFCSMQISRHWARKRPKRIHAEEIKLEERRREEEQSGRNYYLEIGGRRCSASRWAPASTAVRRRC